MQSESTARSLPSFLTRRSEARERGTDGEGRRARDHEDSSISLRTAGTLKGNPEPTLGSGSLLEELYGAPLNEFTQRRNALAKKLVEQGRREEAESVRKLKKPRLPAWAINQLARRAKDLVDRFLEAGQRIEDAGSADAMRLATQERHALAQDLVRRAERILSEAGQSTSSATLHQVSQSLYGTTSAEERDRLRRGILTDPLEGAGFGEALETSPQGAADEEHERRKQKAEKDLQRLRDELDRSEKEAKRLRSEADRTRRGAHAAEQQAAAAAELHVERLRKRTEQQEESLAPREG